MLTKKKDIYRPLAAIFIAGICIMTGFCNCKSGSQSGIREARVKIMDIAPNDLGQVMIFTGDDAGNRLVFVKSFYQPEKNREAIHEQIKKYMNGLERFKGQDVTVVYRKDAIGDLEIVEIR